MLSAARCALAFARAALRSAFSFAAVRLARCARVASTPPSASSCPALRYLKNLKIR